MDPLGAQCGEQQARGEQDQPLVGVREATEQLAPQRVACGSRIGQWQGDMPAVCGEGYGAEVEARVEQQRREGVEQRWVAEHRQAVREEEQREQLGLQQLGFG